MVYHEAVSGGRSPVIGHPLIVAEIKIAATPSIVSEMVCRFHRLGEISRDYLGKAGESRMFAAYG